MKKQHILDNYDKDSEITNEQLPKQIIEEKKRLCQWLNDRYGLHMEMKIDESDIDKNKNMK